jgi:hypothetical protein
VTQSRTGNRWAGGCVARAGKEKRGVATSVAPGGAGGDDFWGVVNLTSLLYFILLTYSLSEWTLQIANDGALLTMH